MPEITILFVLLAIALVINGICKMTGLGARYKQIECPNCKYSGDAKVITPGFFALEIFLYLLFILPGIAYTMWRRQKKRPVCPKCSFQYVVVKD